MNVLNIPLDTDYNSKIEYSKKFKVKGKFNTNKKNRDDNEHKNKRQNTANVAVTDQPIYDDVDNLSFEFLQTVNNSIYYVNKFKRRKSNGLEDRDLFILDSGASVHVFNSTIGLIHHQKPPDY